MMSQRFVFADDYAWPARIVRAVIWAWVMGFMWVVPFMALVVAGAVYLNYTEVPKPAREYDFSDFSIGLAYLPFLLVTFLCAGIALVIGVCKGFAAGIRAEPEEPFWPFRSPYFSSSLDWGGAAIFATVVGVEVAATLHFMHIGNF